MYKLTEIIKTSLLKLPTPINISYWWNYGSLLGIFLFIQIIRGFLLSLHYCPEWDKSSTTFRPSLNVLYCMLVFSIKLTHCRRSPTFSMTQHKKFRWQHKIWGKLFVRYFIDLKIAEHTWSRLTKPAVNKDGAKTLCDNRYIDTTYSKKFIFILFTRAFEINNFRYLFINVTCNKRISTGTIYSDSLASDSADYARFLLPICYQVPLAFCLISDVNMLT